MVEVVEVVEADRVGSLSEAADSVVPRDPNEDPLPPI